MPCLFRKKIIPFFLSVANSEYWVLSLPEIGIRNSCFGHVEPQGMPGNPKTGLKRMPCKILPAAAKVLIF